VIMITSNLSNDVDCHGFNDGNIHAEILLLGSLVILLNLCTVDIMMEIKWCCCSYDMLQV
jgi:hypothetical protein